jgi:hypothetical protein
MGGAKGWTQGAAVCLGPGGVDGVVELIFGGEFVSAGSGRVAIGQCWFLRD